MKEMPWDIERKINSGFRWMWQKIKTHRVMTTIIITVGIIIFIMVGYLLNWEWAGFSKVYSRIWTIGPPKTPNGTAIVQIDEQQQEKTLWDWLDLLGVLAIPVVVGLGAAWYTTQQEKVSAKENTDNQRETALQAYLNKMSDFLLEDDLHQSVHDDKIRTVARIQTLTVLRRLDAERKGSVLQFLKEASLINKDKPILKLKGADLRGTCFNRFDLDQIKRIDKMKIVHIVNFTGTDLNEINLIFDDSALDLDKTELDIKFTFVREINLSGIDLSEVDLKGANLRGSDLREANLSGADLRGTDLIFADLRQADLVRADLRQADLVGADLVGAFFRGTYLYGADLRYAKLNQADLTGADLTGADLKDATGISVEELEKQAKSLKGAIMPDGSKHP